MCSVRAAHQRGCSTRGLQGATPRIDFGGQLAAMPLGGQHAARQLPRACSLPNFPPSQSVAPYERMRTFSYGLTGHMGHRGAWANGRMG
jgi:hypothetical protein